MRRSTMVLVMIGAGWVLGCGGERAVSAHPEPSLDSHVEETKPVAEARAVPWTVTYADGSANVFRFEQTSAAAAARFEYTPMTPERSSSGTYSGGEAKQGTLDAGAVDELWRRIEALEEAVGDHAEARAMGTGSFDVTHPKGTRSFLIKRGERLDEFETFLKPYRGE